MRGERVILSLIELRTVPDNRQELLELPRFCVVSARTRPGCLSSELYETDDEMRTILYLERWRSEGEFYRHIQSNLYRGVLNAMDLAEAPREISFHEIGDTKSLELIVALRGPPKPGVS